MSTPRYAVFGHPVAHSRSPQIHARFAAQTGIALRYERIDAAPADFAASLDRFALEGGRGANVTLPHKPAALALCTTLSARARRAAAVNTLLRIDGDTPRWHGDNTDGDGLVRDLRDRHRIALSGLRVLVLGAGGAAAGVAPALLDAGVSGLVVANRNLERARALAVHLDDARVVAAALDARDVAGHRIDLVINATSAARGGQAPWQALGAVVSRVSVAVDLGYGQAAQPFLDFARGCAVAQRIDGLGMLVEQAAGSFHLWHGVMPDTAPVFACLRDEFGPSP